MQSEKCSNDIQPEESKGDYQDQEKTEEDQPKPLRWYTCATTFLLYLFQIVPCALFVTLFPVLYSVKDFDEDALSVLELGGIPWALKFIFGYIFDNLWRPPRWVVAIMQLMLAGITISLWKIPIDNVNLTAGIYGIYSTIAVAHDVAFDGQMIVIFAGHGALLTVLQQFAYYFFDTILCFVAVENFNPIIFMYIGIAGALFTPLLWVYQWVELPLIPLKGIWQDFKNTFESFIVAIVYFVSSSFSESMVPYFTEYLLETDKKVGNGVGVYNVGLLIGISFGQYLFGCVTYKWCVVIATMIESASIFLIMFLTPNSPYSLIMFLIFVLGIITSLTDSIIHCYLVDSSDSTKTPTFSYSVFQSCYEGGNTLGFVVFPQVKEKTTWRMYWVFNMITTFGVSGIFSLIFFLVPHSIESKILNSKPSLHFEEITSLCKNSANISPQFEDDKDPLPQRTNNEEEDV